MRRLSSVLARVLGLILLVATPAGPAWAHGIAGQRFFPATLTIDDPFVADELSLPSLVPIKEPDGKRTTPRAQFSETITPSLGPAVGAEYNFLEPSDPEEKSSSGFGNPEVSAKYVFFRSDAHETILSLGFSWEIGGAGQKSGGAESSSTISPAIFFGKGLGDLPDAVAY